MSASRRIALRYRQKLMASLRYSGWLLLISGALLTCTIAPLYLGWWDAALPAAIGSAFYRKSGRLDAMALEAGLTPLSEFESPDPLDTHELPVWHDPEAALPTVDHLLARLDSANRVHQHLESLRDALRAAAAKGAKFYFLVLTGGGGTNARVEALRHGDLSVLR